jgi:hypothetical protein
MTEFVMAAAGERDRTAVFVAEDFTWLVERYGKHAILRAKNGAARVTVTAIVKLALFGRATAVVPLADVRGGLSAEDAGLFDGRAMVLVCDPDLEPAAAQALADIIRAEEVFFAVRCQQLVALHHAGALTQDRAAGLCAETTRYLACAIVAHRARIEQVTPPTGNWNLYARGGAVPHPDRLTSAIKGFASCVARVYPPLPPFDSAEFEALLRFHDTLVAAGMRRDARDLLRVALQAPQFALVVRQPHLFAAARAPPLEIAWADYGDGLLRYLFSEELTHAAHRLATGPLVPVTVANSFVMTLDTLIAMGVRHAPMSAEHAFDRLNAYAGGYLAELDLTSSLITGSAIAASAIITDVELQFVFAHYVQYCSDASGIKLKELIAPRDWAAADRLFPKFAAKVANAYATATLVKKPAVPRQKRRAARYITVPESKTAVPEPKTAVPEPKTIVSDCESVSDSDEASSSEPPDHDESTDSDTPPVADIHTRNGFPTSDLKTAEPPTNGVLRFRDWWLIGTNRARSHAAYVAAHYAPTRTMIRGDRMPYDAIVKAVVEDNIPIQLRTTVDSDGATVLALRGYILTDAEKEAQARAARVREPKPIRPKQTASPLPSPVSPHSPSPARRAVRAAPQPSSASDSPGSPRRARRARRARPARRAASASPPPQKTVADIRGEVVVQFDVAAGADLDISIDVASDEEFDHVARAHYDVIRRRYPDAHLTRVAQGGPDDPRHNWTVTCAGSSQFRPVEMYRANFNHVVSHHVGAVSGAFTAALAPAAPPKFYVSSRFALTMDNLATPNYYYFASRKLMPQQVVMKYLNRGFGLDAFPSGLRRALCASFANSWNAARSEGSYWLPTSLNLETDVHYFPAVAGKSYYSAYSLPTEAECCRITYRR